MFTRWLNHCSGWGKRQCLCRTCATCGVYLQEQREINVKIHLLKRQAMSTEGRYGTDQVRSRAITHRTAVDKTRARRWGGRISGKALEPLAVGHLLWVTVILSRFDFFPCVFPMYLWFPFKILAIILIIIFLSQCNVSGT